MALTQCFLDTFTGTADTKLGSHTPDVGDGYGSIAFGSATSTDYLELDGSGNCRGQSSLSGSVAHNLIKAAAAAWASDQSIKVTLATSSTAGISFTIWVRAASFVSNTDANGYRFNLALSNSTWNLRQYTGTTATSTIASGTLSPVYATSDTIELRAVGTTISVLRNGVQFASGTNTAYSSGVPYLGGLSSAANPLYSEVEGFDDAGGGGGGGGVLIASCFM
jgi:hypothetical protein